MASTAGAAAQKPLSTPPPRPVPQAPAGGGQPGQNPPVDKKTAAKEQRERTPSQAANGDGWKLALGIVLLIIAPGIFLVTSSLGFISGSGPNPRGATLPQAINVAAPSSEVQKLLSVFRSASSSQEFLRDDTVLGQYEANLTLLAQKLRDNDPAFASITKKTEVLDLIQVMLQQITFIRSKVTTGTPDQIATEGKKFLANIQLLDQLTLPTVREFALALAAENEASGGTRYPYSQSRRAELPQTGQGASDCSSFVSYVFYRTGLIRIPQVYTTLSLYGAAKKGENGLRIVAESKDSTGIPDDQVRELLEPGDLILSGSRPFSGGKPNQAHVVLYVGNDEVVQSGGGGRGINKTTLENRLQRTTQAIIRAGGAS